MVDKNKQRDINMAEKSNMEIVDEKNRLKKGKRGLLRIVEASIAVLIVLAAILIVSTNKEVKTQSDLSDVLPELLEEIAKNASIRDKIFNDGQSAILDIENFLSSRIRNPSLDYAVVICDDINGVCGLESYPENADGDLFADERVIGGTIGSGYSPKKLKIYLWKIRE